MRYTVQLQHVARCEFRSVRGVEAHDARVALAAVERDLDAEWRVQSASPSPTIEEITAVILRDHVNARGIVDEVGMRAVFEAEGLSVEDRGRVWRAVTGSSPQIQELREQLQAMTPEDRAGFVAWARRAL